MSGFREWRGTRTARAVLWWAEFYSRRVPPALAKARREELISDIYEHYADAARRGLPAAAVNRAVASRALRGIFADIIWGRIHTEPEAGTMAASRETHPAGRYCAGQVFAVLWAALVAVAALGLATSITEMIDTGGQRHGYVPWPGAANISLTLVVLTGSAAALAATAITGALRWRRSKRAG